MNNAITTGSKLHSLSFTKFKVCWRPANKFVCATSNYDTQYKTNGVHKISPNQINDAMNNVPFRFLAFSIENRYGKFSFC